MAKIAIKRGTTSKLVRLFIQDSTSSTGAGLSGLTSSSSGLTAYYIPEGGTGSTAISLSAGTVGTWSSGGFVAIDGTNLPGVYEFGLPNAVLSSGGSVLVMLKGATNMVPVILELQLDAFDYQDSVRLGLTSLPNVAQGTTGSLPTGNASGQVTVVTNNDKTGYALTSGEHTNIASDAQTGLTAQGYTTTRSGYLDTLNGLVSAIWSAATRTLSAFGFSVTASTVSDKTGYSLASSEHTAIAGDVLNATATSYNTAGSIGQKINSAASAGDPWTTSLPGSYSSGQAGYILGTNLNAQVSAVKSKTDNLPSSPAAVGSTMAIDMTQAVPTSNTAQTIGDALNAARADGFGKWVQNGTSLTLYAGDGTTVVRTFTLDSSTTPTQRV